MTRSLESPAGEQFARLFEIQDFLANLNDNETLLDSTLAPVDMDIRPIEDANSLEAFTTSGLYFTRVSLHSPRW